MKGSMIDFFFVTVIILAFGISILLGAYLMSQIFPQLTNAFSSSPDATAVLSNVSGTYGIFDSIFLFIFIAMSIVPIIFAFLIPTNPVLVFVNIILFVVYILIVPSLSNVMRDIWATSIFAPFATGGTGTWTFTIMTSVFQYLPLISVVFSFILMIILFTKSGGGSV